MNNLNWLMKDLCSMMLNKIDNLQVSIPLWWVYEVNKRNYSEKSDNGFQRVNVQQGEDGSENSCGSDTLLQLSNDAALSLSQDHEYLTNTCLKLSKHIEKSRKICLDEIEPAKLFVTVCNTTYLNLITSKEVNTKMMEANSILMCRALVPICKDSSATNLQNFLRFQKTTISQDFDKHTILILNKNLHSKNTLQPAFVETSLVCQNQKFQSNLKTQMKLDDIQLSNLKKLAHFIIVHCLHAVCVAPSTNKEEDNCVSSLFKRYEHSYATLASDKNQTKRHLFTIMLRKQRKRTTVSITKVDSLEENTTKIKQVDIEKYEKVLKPAKRKKLRKHRVVNNNRSGKAEFSSKHCAGQFSYVKSSEGCGYSGSKLHTEEIHRQLKPIKDQINELRKSMTGFNTLNHQFRNNESMIAYDNTNYKLRNIYTYPYNDINCSAQMKELAKILSYSEDSIVKTEIETKKLSPLAEMYVKLSQK